MTQRLEGAAKMRDLDPTFAPVEGDGLAAMPTDADRALMTQLGVSFRQGAYAFGGSRYESLGDALHFARLAAPATGYGPELLK